jgi:hypothetical protein
LDPPQNSRKYRRCLARTKANWNTVATSINAFGLVFWHRKGVKHEQAQGLVWVAVRSFQFGAVNPVKVQHGTMLQNVDARLKIS